MNRIITFFILIISFFAIAVSDKHWLLSEKMKIFNKINDSSKRFITINYSSAKVICRPDVAKDKCNTLEKNVDIDGKRNIRDDNQIIAKASGDMEETSNSNTMGESNATNNVGNMLDVTSGIVGTENTINTRNKTNAITDSVELENTKVSMTTVVNTDTRYTVVMNLNKNKEKHPSIEKTKDMVRVMNNIKNVTISNGIVDIYVGGLWPMKGSWAGGEGMVPFAKMGLEHVNEDPYTLPGYRLHMIWNDTAVSIYSIYKK